MKKVCVGPHGICARWKEGRTDRYSFNAEYVSSDMPAGATTSAGRADVDASAAVDAIFPAPVLFVLGNKRRYQ